MTGPVGRRLLSAADIRVYGNLPPLQQPFRDVVTVFVELAPLPQFFRGHAILFIQSEPLDLLFELSSASMWSGQSRVSPVWISALANRRRDCEWFGHKASMPQH
jgi:hypothetical protein